MSSCQPDDVDSDEDEAGPRKAPRSSPGGSGSARSGAQPRGGLDVCGAAVVGEWGDAAARAKAAAGSAGQRLVRGGGAENVLRLMRMGGAMLPFAGEGVGVGGDGGVQEVADGTV